jgi:hypothetical protein
MLILFVVLFGVYVNKTSDWQVFGVQRSGLEVLQDFARNANFVHVSGNGAAARIWLKPSLAGGTNYSLRVIGRRAEMNWSFSNSTLSASLLFSGMNGSFGIVNVLPGRWTNLTNRGGVVYVEQG